VTETTENHERRGRLRALVSYLPLGTALAVVFGVGLVAEQQGRELTLQTQRTAVALELEDRRAQLEAAIGTQFEVLSRLSGALAAAPDMDRQRFAEVVAALANAPTPMNAVAVVPKNGAMTLSVGEMPASVPAILARAPAARPGARSLASTAHPALLLWSPVRDGVAPADEGAWICVAAVVDTEALFAAAGLRGEDSALDLALTASETGGDVRARAVHLGHAAVLADDPVTTRVAMPGGAWELAARPSGGWTTAGAAVWPIRVLMLLSLALVAVPMLRTRRLVAERQTHVRDLRDREARLQETSKRLSLALDASKVAVWDYNIDADELIWDARMDELYGYPHDGRRTYLDWRNRLHPDDLARSEADFIAAIRETGRYNSEYRIVLDDGHVRHIRAIGAVHRNATGQAKIVGVNWDVTAEVLRSAELEARRAEAEAALNAKSQFLATISHEIRTPMNGVIGMLDLLMRENLTAPQRDRAALVRDSARHLLSIVNNVLDFSKLEAGDAPLETLPVNIGQMAGDVVALMSAGNLKPNVRVFASVDKSVPGWVEGDPTRLRQILTNLVGNALKFTDEGSVELGVAYGDGGILRVAVRDTGTGISEEARGRIFERYQQAEASVARERGGTGLGLAICRQLVERMGGEITVDSVPGLGSTFSFWIPAPRTNPTGGRRSSSPDWSAAERAEVRSARILVAEDNAANRQVLAGYLEMAGHDVRFAGNGAEALEALAEETFDLVILDVHMPVMDGLTCARRIRALGGPAAQVPIIALTGDLSQQEPGRFAAAGMTAHVFKPVTVDALFDALDRAGVDRSANDLGKPDAKPRTAS